MKLARDQLVSLFNALYTLDTTRITVFHPSGEIGELLEIDISDPVETTVRFTKGALAYRDVRETLHTRHGERVYDELPDKETYIRALVAGELIDVENREEIQTFLRGTDTRIWMPATHR